MYVCMVTSRTMMMMMIMSMMPKAGHVRGRQKRWGCGREASMDVVGRGPFGAGGCRTRTLLGIPPNTVDRYYVVSRVGMYVVCTAYWRRFETLNPHGRATRADIKALSHCPY